jgi:putative ABC transport system permease protein
MIRHLFRIIWNKKRHNALITIEILISFLVLYAVITMSVLGLIRYNQPLGYSYENVWNIGIDTRLSFDSVYNAEKRSTVQQLLLSLRGTPEIEQVCAWAIPPYSNMMSTWGADVNGKLLRIAIHDGSEEAREVLGLNLIEGRWFEPGDKSLNPYPVVINEMLAHRMFGSESPLGKNPFPKGDKPPTTPEKDYRVIGVIDDFRKGGELSEPMYTVIKYLDIERTTQAISSNLLIKVRPGTTAEFKEKLDRQMTAVAKGWSFEISTLGEMRRASFKPQLTFVLAVGLVAGFLLLMVALGLIGVLWQNVSRRTKEIGLRRALGGTSKNIYWQILGELLVLTSFGLFVGSLGIAQFPLLELIASVPANVYFFSLLISLAFMYGMSVLCGLYPSWLAMEIEPAEALHYE